MTDRTISDLSENMKSHSKNRAKPNGRKKGQTREGEVDGERRRARESWMEG